MNFFNAVHYDDNCDLIIWYSLTNESLDIITDPC